MKMILLKSTQKSLAVVGITPNQSVQSHPFNGNVLKTYVSYLLSCILFCVYFLRVANDFRGYILSIYVTSMTVVVSINYTILVFQSPKAFELIVNFEKTIEERK